MLDREATIGKACRLIAETASNGAQLAVFQAGYRERYPAITSFASLTSEQQIAYLGGVDQTPFFNTTRLLTLLGMFSLPAYGGNRGKASWRMLGFPGLPATYAGKIEEYRGKRYVAEPQSIADFS